jgi:hypothetical protein
MKEQQELAGIRDQVKALSEEAAAKRANVEALTNKERELDRDVKDRERRISELMAKENRIDSKLKEYTGKGITDKAFRRLDRISFGEQDELISRLDTAERYKDLLLEFKVGESDLLTQANSRDELRLEKDELTKEIATLRNKRDEELSKNYVQSESIRILSTFYEDKYTSKDIEGIRIGLNTLGIGGNPRTSVRRLVDALDSELELSRLNTEILAKSIELEKLVKAIEVAKGQINSFRDVALASIKKFETDSKTRIESVFNEATGKVKSLGQTTEKHIEEISSSYISAIGNASKAGIGTLIDVHNQAKLEIEETVDTVRKEVQLTIRQEFDPYREAFKLIPQMQPFASYGFLLMRVPEDRLIAERVPAIFVSLMANSIDSWVREMMPEAETKPPKDVTIIAPMLLPEWKCKLVAVSTWLRQELMNLTRFK